MMVRNMQLLTSQYNLAMNHHNQEKLSPAAQTTIFYENMLGQSKQMQEVAENYASTLTATILALKLNEVNAKSFKAKEMKETKEKLDQMIQKMKDHLQNEVSLLTTISQSINHVTQQFRDILNVMKIENERADLIILQLDSQITVKEIEIAKCRNNIDTFNRKIQVQIWRNHHYIHQEPNLINSESSGLYFVQILQDLQNKLKTKLKVQETEISFFNIKLCNKLIDFKQKLKHIWSFLPTNNDKCPILEIRSPQNEHTIPYPISPNNRRDLSDQESSEQSRDEIQMRDIEEIKKKLSWSNDINRIIPK